MVRSLQGVVGGWRSESRKGQRVEVLGVIEDPDRILAGNEGEKMAVKKISADVNLVVVYRELEDDGFIITAFITSKAKWLNRREQIWPK